MQAIRLLMVYVLLIFLSALFAVLYLLTNISSFANVGYLGLYTITQSYYANGSIAYQTETHLISYLQPIMLFFLGLLLLRANNNALVRKAKFVAVSYLILGSFVFIQELLMPLFFATGQNGRLQLFNLIFTLIFLLPILAAVIFPFFIKVYSPSLIRLKRILYLYLPISFVLSLILQNSLPIYDPSLIDIMSTSGCTLLFLYLFQNFNQEDIITEDTELSYPQAGQSAVPTVK